MNTITVFAIAALATYLLRSFVVLAGDRVAQSRALESVIGLVSPAVLAAIVASSLLVHDGSVAAPDPAGLTAAVGALVAVRRTGNVAAALFIGLPIYWLGALVGLA